MAARATASVMTCLRILVLRNFNLVFASLRTFICNIQADACRPLIDSMGSWLAQADP